MGFSVHADSLKNLSKQLDRLQEDAGKGNAYVDDHAVISFDQGIINRIKGGHAHVTNTIQSFLRDVDVKVAASTSRAVDFAADYYEHTENTVAARIDSAVYHTTPAQVSQPDSSYWARHAGVGVFADTGKAQAYYKGPTDYNSEFPHKPDWVGDILSPGSAARDTVWSVTSILAKFGLLDRAYDPYESWVKPFVGDWAGLRGCADVFTNVADALIQMSDNIYHSVLTMHTVWEGNAAEGCKAYLDKIEQMLSSASSSIRELAPEYSSKAEGAFKLGQSVGTLISDIVDSALILAAEIAGAAASSESLIGPLLFGGAGAWEVKEIIQAIGEISDIIARAEATMDALDSAGNDFGVVSKKVALPQVPSAPPPLPFR